MPGVVYGLGRDPAMVAVDRRVDRQGTAIAAVFRAACTNCSLKKKQRILPKDVQLHPVTDEPMHVDFMRLADDARVAVNVPVTLSTKMAARA